jgi:hypothetical protein
MKLLKYVMTSDSGLAPNPFHGFCSLALCTPNHRKAKLEVGDWIVGHSSKKTGWKLIHAIRVTRILTMQEYFHEYPEKRPDPYGSREQQTGDNLYFIKDGRWKRLPSSEHNDVRLFEQDQGCPVFLSKEINAYWYFGGLDNFTTREFADRYPELIKDRQGFSYVRDEALIRRFVKELELLGQSGTIGNPRDEPELPPRQFLVSIDPEPTRIDNDYNLAVSDNAIANGGCVPRTLRVPAVPSAAQTSKGCR